MQYGYSLWELLMHICLGIRFPIMDKFGNLKLTAMYGSLVYMDGKRLHEEV